MYLSEWSEGESTRIELGPDATLSLGRAHGRASVLQPALFEGDAPVLGETGAVLFLVPASPSKLLARIVNDLEPTLASRTCIGHGHACVVLFLDSVAEAQEVLGEVENEVRGWELWPHERGTVLDSAEVREPTAAEGWIHPVPIDGSALKYNGRSQIDQFNNNLALLSRIAQSYAPETQSLTTSLRKAVADIANKLAEIQASPTDENVREGIALEAVLIETNSVLTLHVSQLGSGSLPLRSQTFAAGEYSLLGIGAMCRAAWRIYAHLNETFAAHDHVGVMRRHYATATGFNPYSGSSRVDFSDWRRANRGVEVFADEPNGASRQHIPFFSSRWGFHEGLHSISLSWQCLYASASKEWNLLTLTHEFLHSHVRSILGFILAPQVGESDLALEMVNLFNQHLPGENMLMSMRLALVEALFGLRGGLALARRVHGGDEDEEVGPDRRIDVAQLQTLVRRHFDLLDEIMVHVLDYQYIYNGRDEDYVNSIWISWSLVPGVVDRVEEYVLRTLCALSVTSAQHLIGPEIFEDVVERLETNLKLMEGRSRSHHAVSLAIRLLEDERGVARLRALFPVARYVVELTESFVFDGRLNAALVVDDLTTIEDNRTTYNIATGDYRGEVITSPIGFLLDRFPRYPDQAGAGNVEYESIWQMLQLI